MRIGLDFGTTNTSAAYYNRGELSIIPSKFSDTSGILPSLIYIKKDDYSTFYGKSAVLHYLQDETGRPAKWETYHAGILSYWVGTDPEPTLVTEDIWLQVDIGAKGRLLQSVKTALRSRYYAGTSIFGKFYTLEDLIALILREIHDAAVIKLGQNVDSVLLGRPVKFSEDADIDKRAQAILKDAANASGFSDVNFMAEPIAAAYSYHIKLNKRSRVLVFDFGGGTLDLTVMNIGGKEDPQVLSTEGVLIGGDDLDQQIMESFLLRYFGKDIPYKRDLTLPFDVYEILLSWSRHPELTRGTLYYSIREAVNSYKDGPEFKSLLSLINNKYGFQLFETIEKVKVALSDKEEDFLRFHVTDIDIDRLITRKAFSVSIEGFIKMMEDGITEVLKKANTLPDQIDLVLCTGGSSAVVAVQDMLSSKFGKGKIEQHESFLGVSSGLAVAASIMGK